MDRNSDIAMRVATALIPVILAIAGWAYSIDGRLRDVTARQDERGPRIKALEDALHGSTERFDQRLARTEERINNLHLFILQNMPSGKGIGGFMQKRGDIQPPSFADRMEVK
jgi:hypothetical protein